MKKLFGKKERVIKGKYDISYLIHPDSALDYHIVKHGIFQDWIATKLGNFIPSNGIVMDIGANAGFLTLLFAKKHVSQGKVYAFEPDEENFEQLMDNIKLNSLKNILPFKIAIQDDPKKKQIKFYKRRAIDGDKLCNRGLSTLEKMSIHNISEYFVKCSTIDKIMEKEKISKLDFIKIDVEGAEYKVLRGGLHSIEQYHPIILYECSTTIDKLSNSKNSLQSYQILKELGYKQFKIVEEKMLIELDDYDANLDSTNIIAFHSSKIPEIS